MKTENEVREEFFGYYSDLRDAQIADGCPAPCKADEWDFFIAANIAAGDLPTSARNWKCPRRK